MQNTPTRKTSAKLKGDDDRFPVPKTFGDQFTAEHIILHMNEPSRKGHGVSLVILDRACHYLLALAGKEQSEEEIEWAVQRFIGSGGSVKHVYTDGSKEFRKAFRSLGFPHDSSRPHRPQKNGFTQRAVREVTETEFRCHFCSSCSSCFKQVLCLPYFA